MLPAATHSSNQSVHRNGHSDSIRKAANNVDILPSKELIEARSRIAQMEKTMRWWSDCTAAWREKWQRTRNERNALKKELKDLQKTFDELSKAYTALRRDTESKITSLMQHIYDVSNSEKENLDTYGERDISQPGCKPKRTGEIASQTEFGDLNQAEVACQTDEADDGEGGEKLRRSDSADFSFLETALAQSDAERQSLLETIAKLNEEVAQLRDSLASVSARNNTQSFNESSSSSVMMTASLHEHSEVLAQQTGELQQRLERLQSENAVEYARREQLESEKMALERENKQLKASVTDMQSQLQAARSAADRSRHLSAAPVASSVQSLAVGVSQSSLAGSVSEQDHAGSGAALGREFSEMRAKYENAKRLLHERAADADHQARRIEAYEQEVKHLRKRINELKEALRTSEDELDAERTSSHRLERLADDLRAELDRLRVELDYSHRRSLHAATEPNSSAVSLNEPRRTGYNASAALAGSLAVPSGIRLTERAASCGVAPLGVDFGLTASVIAGVESGSVETMTDSATPRTMSSREVSVEPDALPDSALAAFDSDVIIHEIAEDSASEAQ